DQASYFATHNHRQHQLNSFMNELLAMSIQKRVRARSVCDKKLCDVVFQKRLLLRFFDLKSTDRLVLKAPDRNATEWTRTGTLNDRATPQSESAEKQVHRGPHHFVEVACACYLLAQVGQGAECVDELVG